MIVFFLLISKVSQEGAEATSTAGQSGGRRQRGWRHYEYGSYLLRNGDRGFSRHQMFQAMRRGRFDWRVLTTTAVSLLPHRVFAALREIRQSLGHLGSKKRTLAIP